MQNVAVIICLKKNGNINEFLGSLRSFQQDLKKGDCVFIHFDGFKDSKVKKIVSEIKNIPIDIIISPSSCGLAAGLNKLINKVLLNRKFGFIARMDADDLCINERFQKQKRFLIKNPKISILGSSVIEHYKKHGTEVIKMQPSLHENIIKSLAFRNPLNHPSVMFRRNVFKSGLRYKENVGLVEDWHLWIDAAKNGFIFHNSATPFVKFFISPEFFVRRAGLKRAFEELHARRSAQEFVQPKDKVFYLSFLVFAFVFRILPIFLQKNIYKKFLRAHG